MNFKDYTRSSIAACNLTRWVKHVRYNNGTSFTFNRSIHGSR